MSLQRTEVLKLRLERVIRADRDRVFAAWTRPELIERWSAPEGMTVEEGEVDLRAGGRWRVVMLERDGTRHEAFGTYREVAPPERLVYTHAWRRGGGEEGTPETVVTVEFHAEAGATRVVLMQEGFGSPQSRDGHGEGWASTLNRLEAMFAEGGGVAGLRHLARLTRDVVYINVEGISHEESLIQPRPAGNCLNWVLGHLLAIYDEVLGLLGQTPVWPGGALARYARGSSPITDPSEALPLEDLVRAWDEACARIEAGLAALPEARLAEPVPEGPTADPGETVGSLLFTVLFHQAYHAGQLGLLRRLAGKPGAIA